VRVKEVRTTERERSRLNTKSLVEEVRHGTSDGLILKELRGVFRLKTTLVERLSVRRKNRRPGIKLPGDAQPAKYARIDVRATKCHTSPLLG
jgi:hypothetical protein